MLSDDFTAEELSQITAMERLLGASDTRKTLGLSRIALANIGARIALPRPTVHRIARMLLDLRGDPEPEPDSAREALLHGRMIAQDILDAVQAS